MAKAPKAPSKRLQMVKGSVWRFTQDATLTYRGRNPKYHSTIQEFWNKKRVEFDRNQTPHLEQYKLRDAYLAERGIEEIIDMTLGSVKAGEEFTVTGKFFTGYDFEGFGFPATIRGKKMNLIYTAVEPYIEAINIPQVKEYALRDRVTGKFYAGLMDRYWASRDKGLALANMVDTFMKAKRFGDMNKLRLNVMGFTGYYDGLPGAEAMPEWAGGPKVFDLPETWEVVEYDKTAKAEIQTIDIQPWYKRLWELRELTVRYGSPVRKLYNEIDKKGDLDKFPVMLAIRSPIEESQWSSYVYHADELSDADVAGVEDMVGGLGLKKTEMRRAKDNFCMVVAFKDENAAFHAKFLYRGKMRLGVINTATLKEVHRDAVASG